MVYPKGLPQSRWLRHYATLFDTVEVNSTFYRLPKREPVARWVEQTPDGFVFAVKSSRYLTHVRRLTDLDGGVERFYERIEPLVRSPKMGPVLWQLPATFHRDDERLRNALAALPDGRHAFEFRHETWFVPEVYELLRAHGAALVIGDHPERPFQAHELTADWTSSDSTTGIGGETATTRSASSRSGPSASTSGATGPWSTPTSTTTGVATRSGTGSG